MVSNKFWSYFFATIFVLASLMIFLSLSGVSPKLFGFATEGSTTSNVTISTYYAIGFSTQLNNGIQFGTVSSLPADDINASQNYAGGSSATNYYVDVSTDSNSPVEFCIKANSGLTSPDEDVIGVGNQTYSNSTISNATLPSLASKVSLTTDFVKASSPIPVGDSNYLRFWLDVPAGTAAATYNNTITISGTVTGSC